MKKFVFGLLLVLLAVVGLAYAADFTFDPITVVSGNPGETVSVNVTVNNQGTTSTTYNFVSTELTYGTNIISAPTIPAITVANGTSGIATFSVVLPATLAGTYQANITATDASNATNTLSTGLVDVITVLSKSDMDVLEDSFKVESQDDMTSTKSNVFTIKNKGSTQLVFGTNDITFTYDASNFTDTKGNVVSLSFTDLSTITLNPNVEQKVSVTSAVPKGMKEGAYTGNMTVTSGTLTDTVILNLVVMPEVCEEGEKGTDLEFAIEDPDSGDEYKPGETIEVEVKVWNNADEDLDIEVHAFLYDLDDNNEIVDITSDEVEVDEDDNEKISFNLVIPTDEDIDDDHNFILYVKAYEEGQEDDNCVQDYVDIDIERDKNDVIITKFDVTPTVVNPGETIEFTVDVDNVGTNDQDDVTVKIVETDLGLSLVSNNFDLEKAEDDDHDHKVRFTFTVPSNIAAKTYSVSAGVYDEDDDVFDQSDDAEKFISLVVSGGALVVTDEVDIKVTDTPSAVEAGKTYSIPVKVTNNKAVQGTFTAKLTNIDDWAESASEKILTLKAGQSETVYLSLKANEEVGEGKYSATVEVKDNLGSIVGTETVTLGAEEKADWSSYFGGSKVFWIIGDIILVIIAIFFIKLIFSRGRGKVKEVRL